MNEVKNVFIKKSYFDHDGNMVKRINCDGSIRNYTNKYEAKKTKSNIIKYVLCGYEFKDNDELYDESRIDNIKYDESGNACCWYNVDTDTFTERNRFAADEKISREFEYVYDENNDKLIRNDTKYRYERFGNMTITTRTYFHYNEEGNINRAEISVKRKEDGSNIYTDTIIDQAFSNGTMIKSDYYEDICYEDDAVTFNQQRTCNGTIDYITIMDIDKVTGRVKGYTTKYNKEINAVIEKKVEYKYDNNGVVVEIFEEKLSNVANEKTGIPELRTTRTYQYHPINDDTIFENIFKDEEIAIGEAEEVTVYTKFDQFKYTDTEEA